MAIGAHKTAILGGALILLLGGAALAGHGVYLAAKAQLAQILLNHAWARTRADGAAHRPWSWADMHAVARLRVPAHGVDQIVLAGASGRTLAFGPGHVPGTAPPGGDGPSVISGHRDTHFRFLEHVRPGDTLFIERPNTTHRYVVRRTDVIDLDREGLALDPSVRRLVLVTCYPFRDWSTGGPARYIVTAEPAKAISTW